MLIDFIGLFIPAKMITDKQLDFPWFLANKKITLFPKQ